MLALLPSLLLLGAGAGAAAPDSTPSGPSLAVYAYSDDPGAAGLASHAADLVLRRAAGKGWHAGLAPRVGDLLDRAPDDVVRAAESIATARAAYQEALDESTRLRLEQAQEALLRARAAYLDAAAAPAYKELANVELYLGIVSLNLGQLDAATHFRSAAFLAPNLSLDPNVFPPSVIEAFNGVRRTMGNGAKGSLKVETDLRGALVVIDGVARGPAPRLVGDLPEGTHFVEARAPGATPQFMSVDVPAGVETPVVFTMRAGATSLRAVWMESRGEAAMSAVAKILQADRVVLISARTTVAGVSPYAMQGGAFQPAGRIDAEDAAAARDSSTTDERLGKLADHLLAVESGVSKGPGVSRAASYAARSRFVGAGGALATVTGSFEYSNMIFDSHGHYVSATRFDATQPYQDSEAYKDYTEVAATIDLRYGLRDGTVLVIEAPLLRRTIDYDYLDGNQNLHDRTARGSGIGDVVAGLDVRLPALESARRSLVYLSTRVKLPTGDSGADGFLRSYGRLPVGTGQYDLYAGLGATWANQDDRLDAEVGWNANLPGEVYWADDNANRAFLNMGDQQIVHVDVARHLGAWLAPEIYLDFRHRDRTKEFESPFDQGSNGAPESYLADLGFAARFELSEKVDAGAKLDHPVWGRANSTFMPIADVAGPRLTVYYGRRF